MQRLDPTTARALLEQVGFLLVPGAPMSPGTAYLLVAIRRRPTLEHFDPERVDYWVSRDQRGLPASIDWASRISRPTEFSWGLIRVIDRLNVSNEFVTFGGRLELGRFDDVHVAVFSSEAPIVARGGHSQDWARESQEITEYLARLRAAAVPKSELEARLAGASPMTRYSAFLADAIALRKASDRKVGWQRPDTHRLEAERSRLRGGWPDDWQAGLKLEAAVEWATEAGRKVAGEPQGAVRP